MAGTFWKTILALVVSGVWGAVGLTITTAQGAVTDCTGFASFDEANAYYSDHPEAADAIDDDQDGTACEVYFGLERRERRAGPETNANSRQRAVALAQEAEGELDCEDFQTQEDAQAVLDADPGDPNNLDPNGDGVACALLPAATDIETAQAADEPGQTAEAGTETPRERRANRNQRNQQEEAAPPTCADFATAEDAQAAYDADPEGLTGLDGDGNGVACEELIVEETVEEPVDDAAARREERRNRRAAEEGGVEEAPVEETIDEPGPPAVAEDIDCVDFDFQEEAQAVFDENPADPYNLDPNGDGFACSSLPSSAPPVVTQVPKTGTGGESDWLARSLAAASMLAALAAGENLRRRGRLTARGAAFSTWKR